MQIPSLKAQDWQCYVS